jgi:hypothetical protein
MSNLDAIERTAKMSGAAEVLELLGISAGEISQSKARDVYGKWFMDAVAKGRIRPCRVEDGHRGTRLYRVVDILDLKTADLKQAQLITK